MLPLGDKSPPEEVWKLFPGMSKSQFKSAVGALLRDGAIEISEKEMHLVPAEERVPIPAKPYDGKSPRGFKIAAPGATLFVGNIAFSVDDIGLARAIEEVVGPGHIAKVRVTRNDFGESKGFAHVDFFDPSKTQEALPLLQDLLVGGRSIRVELKRGPEVSQLNRAALTP
jgi:RNA recognition motif-containing protein